MAGRTFALLAAVTAMLAACSAQDTPAEPTPSSTSTTATTTAGGHGGYAQCLSEHGVPAAPGPVAGPPPGVDEQTWQQAVQACSTLAPGPA